MQTGVRDTVTGRTQGHCLDSTTKFYSVLFLVCSMIGYWYRIVVCLSVRLSVTLYICGAVVERWTRDRKVAGSAPGWGAIRSTMSTQPSIPPG